MKIIGITVCLILLFQAATLRHHTKYTSSLSPRVSHNSMISKGPYVSYKLNHRTSENYIKPRSDYKDIKHLLNHQLKASELSKKAKLIDLEHNLEMLQLKMDVYLQEELKNDQIVESYAQIYYGEQDKEGKGYLTANEFTYALDMICDQYSYPRGTYAENLEVAHEAIHSSPTGQITYEVFKPYAVELLNIIAYDESR